MSTVDKAAIYQPNTVRIDNVAHVDTLNVVEDNKTLWNRFLEGASWSAGAATGGFITYKVCNIAYNAFFGAKAGAEAGSAFGPSITVLAAVAGGTVGAAKGMLV